MKCIVLSVKLWLQIQAKIASFLELKFLQYPHQNSPGLFVVWGCHSCSQSCDVCVILVKMRHKLRHRFGTKRPNPVISKIRITRKDYCWESMITSCWMFLQCFFYILSYRIMEVWGLLPTPWAAPCQEWTCKLKQALSVSQCNVTSTFAVTS